MISVITILLYLVGIIIADISIDFFNRNSEDTISDNWGLLSWVTVIAIVISMFSINLIAMLMHILHKTKKIVKIFVYSIKEYFKED